MKKVLLLLLVPASSFSQKVGINIIDPKYTLHIKGKLGVDTVDFIEGKDTFLYQNKNGEIMKSVSVGMSGLTADRGIKKNTPSNVRLADTVEGPGIKLQYVVSKYGAFRSGSIEGDQWDIKNIGNASVAFGSNTKANGAFSFAAGQQSWANGNNSFAMGPLSMAGGYASVAFAGGKANDKVGGSCFAFGSNSISNQQLSWSIGFGVVSDAYMVFAQGDGNYMNARNAAVFGSYNDTTGYYLNKQFNLLKDKNPLFVVGNGLSVNNRSDALKIYKDATAKVSGVWNYAQDYSNQFTDLSLVNKGYVDKKMGMGFQGILDVDKLMNKDNYIDGGGKSFGFNNNSVFSVFAENELVLYANKEGYMYGPYWEVDGTFKVAKNIVIGLDPTEPSAVFEIQSNSQGAVLPRMKSMQKNAIANPAIGLTLYCLDCIATDGSIGVMQTFNGNVWKNNW